MAKTGNSKYYPQNTTVHISDTKERAEIFWQTVNANHLLENYKDKVSQYGKDHDLKFNDFKNLLSGNTLMKRKKENNYVAITYVVLHAKRPTLKQAHLLAPTHRLTLRKQKSLFSPSASRNRKTILYLLKLGQT